MSVYVDKPQDYPGDTIALAARKHGTRWCHLWCDSGDENALHRIAFIIGLSPAWFQADSWFPHYDIVPSKYRTAVKAGAKPMEFKDWVKNNSSRSTGTSQPRV